MLLTNPDLLDQLVASKLPECIAIRHHIHAHPELSFQEYETAKFVSEKLTSYGIAHQTGIAGTGIVALIEGKNPTSKIIALRADMDALPILEKNETTRLLEEMTFFSSCSTCS